MIKVIALSSATGEERVSTSELAAGIYYYRLKLNHGVSEMKRLLISR
ncbi:MAG: hypothetical protein ACLFT3_18720 [Cyclobacteriaceae bacterium]